MNGTYTQRRRAQMAGGGITSLNMPRKHYLFGKFGDWIGDVKDKIVDDIIPNELKESPIGTALVGGALLNQFGLPMGIGSLEKGAGQNWLGELLGKVPGIGGTVDLVLGGQEGPQYQTLGSGIKNLLTGGAGLPPQLGGSSTVQDAINYLGGKLNIPGSGPGTGPDASGRYPIRWKEPLAIGTTIGAADYLTRSDDKMPEQLAIDPSRFATAEAAMADPNLRFKPQEAYTLKDGGRIGYDIGGPVLSEEQNAMVMDMLNKGMDDDTISTITGVTPEDIQIIINQINEAQKGLEESGALENLKAQGGRIGYEGGGIMMASAPSLEDSRNEMALQLFGKPIHKLTEEELMIMDEYNQSLMAQGGRIRAQEGGLMNLGGMEKDYRQEGGFVPIGGQEKADDVPARLSKNEFVFTADAVRNAGGGDIDEGAAVMENLMNHLEAGGKISEDSQGLEGAQAMYANTQKLQNRII